MIVLNALIQDMPGQVVNTCKHDSIWEHKAASSGTHWSSFAICSGLRHFFFCKKFTFPESVYGQTKAADFSSIDTGQVITFMPKQRGAYPQRSQVNAKEVSDPLG